jgi:hypothetical protein
MAEKENVREELARLIHARFDERSIETRWASDGSKLDWEQCPATYQEALRLTVDDVLESDWVRRLVLVAGFMTLTETAEEWMKHADTGEVKTLSYAGVPFVRVDVVKAYLLGMAGEIQDEL